MRLFGFVIERDKSFSERDARWFGCGFDAGWASAMKRAEEVIRTHKPGVAVLRISPDLSEKLNAEREVSA